MSQSKDPYDETPEGRRQQKLFAEVHGRMKRDNLLYRDAYAQIEREKPELTIGPRIRETLKTL